MHALIFAAEKSLSSSQSATPALIAAGASLVVALVTAIFSRRQAVALKKLEGEQIETNAKVAYNYEARKRLYAVCEPLLFHAAEQAQEARSRIRGLAKAARGEHLQVGGSGWLGAPHNYFFRSTVYSLLAPLTSFSILQRRLTTIDLSLDTDVRAKYEILKLIFFSFKSDWNLAEWGDESQVLAYDRNKSDPGVPGREQRLRDHPDVYAPQGLYRALLYVVAEALISAEDGAQPQEAERCATYGEFQREWGHAERERRGSLARRSLDRLTGPGGPASTMGPVFDDLVELFEGFHPASKPVLWRVLVSQYLLYGALLAGKPELVPFSDEETASFDWRPEGSAAADPQVSLQVAQGFVGEQLATVHRNLESR